MSEAFFFFNKTSVPLGSVGPPGLSLFHHQVSQFLHEISAAHCCIWIANYCLKAGGSILCLLLLQVAVLSSGASLPWPETLGCPGQLTGIWLPTGMAGLTVMGWLETFVLTQGRPQAKGRITQFLQTTVGVGSARGTSGWAASWDMSGLRRLMGKSILPRLTCPRLRAGSSWISSCQPGHQETFTA